MSATILNVNDREPNRYVISRVLRSARAAVRTRDEFFSIASHELRNPLSALVLQLQRLQRELHRGPEMVHRDVLAARVDAAERNATRLSELVQDLLDTTRIRAGRLDLALAQVDLTTLMDDVVRRLETAAAAANTRFEFRSNGPIVGSWDPSRVEQVMSNLLSNAIKYGEGSPVEIAAWRDERDAFFSIADRGMGMSGELLSRIFAPFERGELTGRSGLGLYIARKIVESHAGRIDVKSAPGQGTTFTVTLPLKPPGE